MTLPRIQHPLFELEIPSTNKKIKVRQMLVKEEKILLMAKSSEDPSDIFLAIQQVVNNCIADATIPVESLTLFDLEYLFIRIRSMSVNNIVETAYRDHGDNELRKFTIDLNKLEVKFPENIDKTIKITDTSGVMMRYPVATLYSDKTYLNLVGEEATQYLIMQCLDKYFEGDSMVDFKTEKKEDIAEFLDNLDLKVYPKMKDFVTQLPSLFHEIKYTNKEGIERVIVLKSLSDFFILD